MSEKVEDFLSVDNPIPGQNFACLSFVSPEKILPQKNTYFLHTFLKSVAEKYELDLNTISDEYDTYVYNNNESLEKQFYESNDFQTTMRGLKIRGTYDTRREAEVRAQVLRRQDPNFHVFVGQVGYWLPWDPEADNIEDQEYDDNSLNKLVKKYQENKKKKDIFFEKQKQESLVSIQTENSKVQEDNNDSTLENLEKQYNNIPDSIIKDTEDPWMQNKLQAHASLDKKDVIGENQDTTQDTSQFLDLDK